MARYNDNSPHPQHWTNAKLIRELRSKANLERFSANIPADYKPASFSAGKDDGDMIREATRLYRDSWMNPILDEIERRFVKTKKEA